MDENDISNIIKNVSQMINDGNIPDEIKNIVGNLKSDNSSSVNNSATLDFETILKMKSIFEKMNSTEDPRANLLRSLKPYLKNSRQSKVDQYIQLFNMTKVMDILKPNGGESTRWYPFSIPILQYIIGILSIAHLVHII